MRAVVKVRFFDVVEKVQREVEDVIEVSKERFDEINSKIDGALAEVAAKKKPAKEPKAEEAE